MATKKKATPKAKEDTTLEYRPIIEVKIELPTVKIKTIDSRAEWMPTKAHDEDGAFDIKARLKDNEILNAEDRLYDSAGIIEQSAITKHRDMKGRVSVVLHPGCRTAIPTGILSDIPEGYCVKIYPRSGLALKKGLVIVNAPGIIDSTYRDEWKVIVQNIGITPITITNKDRIAQCQIEKLSELEFEKVSTIKSDKDRNGGMGSTGN